MPGALAPTGYALVLSENGRFRTEIPLVRERLSIGRRSRNDLVLDDLTVSGEHALVQVRPEGVLIRDLESRNGTHVNGRPIVECQLAEGDCIDIGIYRLRLVRARQPVAPHPGRSPGVEPDEATETQATGLPLPAAGPAVGPGGAAVEPQAAGPGAEAVVAAAVPVLEYLTGPYAGITQRVDRNIMRISDGGTQAAVITRRRHGWFLTHLEGMAVPVVNGVAIGLVASPLADGDLIELAAARVRFRLQG
jgi:hypothetical protein